MTAANGYAQHPRLGALRHHRHDRGLVLQRHRRLRLHLRDRARTSSTRRSPRSSTSTSAPGVRRQGQPRGLPRRPGEHRRHAANHSVLTGKAPKGATLRLRKQFSTPTWAGSFTDNLNTTMKVGATGKYTWHVNQSTRPVVRTSSSRSPRTSRCARRAGGWTDHGRPVASTTTSRSPRPGLDLLQVDLDWPTPDDLDLEVYKKNADGSLTQVGSSGNFVGEKESRARSRPRPRATTCCG